MFDILVFICHTPCTETRIKNNKEKYIEYFAFLEKDINALDILATCEAGYVKVEAVVLDGETEHETNINFEGDTGILYENEEEELIFISHCEIIGLVSEGY